MPDSNTIVLHLLKNYAQGVTLVQSVVYENIRHDSESDSWNALPHVASAKGGEEGYSTVGVLASHFAYIDKQDRDISNHNRATPPTTTAPSIPHAAVSNGAAAFEEPLFEPLCGWPLGVDSLAFRIAAAPEKMVALTPVLLVH